MFENSLKQINNVIKLYFDGLFYGDIGKLQRVFLKSAHLYGDIKGVPYSKTFEEYLAGVKARKSPNEQNEPFKMKTLSVEILENTATARLHVPMLGFNYYDSIALARIDGEWKIVNKLFVHVD